MAAEPKTSEDWEAWYKEQGVGERVNGCAQAIYTARYPQFHYRAAKWQDLNAEAVRWYLNQAAQIVAAERHAEILVEGRELGVYPTDAGDNGRGEDDGRFPAELPGAGFALVNSVGEHRTRDLIAQEIWEHADRRRFILEGEFTDHLLGDAAHDRASAAGRTIYRLRPIFIPGAGDGYDYTADAGGVQDGELEVGHLWDEKSGTWIDPDRYTHSPRNTGDGETQEEAAAREAPGSAD